MITIDLRSLNNLEFSGVEFFTTNVIERLISTDHQNTYKLFYNGFGLKTFEQFQFINAQYKQTRIPNRILNLLIKIFGIPKIESLAGETNHVFMPNPNLVALRSTTKLTLVIHDLSPLLMPEFYSLKSRIWHRLVNIKKLCKRADQIIAVSEYTKKSIVEICGVDPNKITVAHLGVDHDRYRPNIDQSVMRGVRNKYLLPQEYLLFVATIEPRKNLIKLIEAFNMLQGNEHLVIAGKFGWNYNDVISQINNSPKNKQIHLLGYVPESDKPALIKMAKVFVWPSIFEGFGLPVLEAMAVGTPVVTSNVSSLPEVCEESALLVDPYNSAHIAKVLHEVLNDKQLREQLSMKGLAQASKFSWDKTVEVIKNSLYKS